MATTFSWTFSGEVFCKDLPGMPGAIVRIECQLHATDGAKDARGNFRDVAHGVVVDLGAPDPANFTPQQWDGLNLEQLRGWVEQSIPAAELAARKVLLQTELDALSRAPIAGAYKFLPWEYTTPDGTWPSLTLPATQ